MQTIYMDLKSVLISPLRTSISLNVLLEIMDDWAISVNWGDGYYNTAMILTHAVELIWSTTNINTQLSFLVIISYVCDTFELSRRSLNIPAAYLFAPLHIFSARQRNFQATSRGIANTLTFCHECSNSSLPLAQWCQLNSHYLQNQLGVELDSRLSGIILCQWEVWSMAQKTYHWHGIQ